MNSENNSEHHLLNEDINRRVAKEKELKPKHVNRKKRSSAEKMIGIIMFVVLLGNLFYMFASFVFNHH